MSKELGIPIVTTAHWGTVSLAFSREEHVRCQPWVWATTESKAALI